MFIRYEHSHFYSNDVKGTYFWWYVDIFSSGWSSLFEPRGIDWRGSFLSYLFKGGVLRQSNSAQVLRLV